MKEKKLEGRTCNFNATVHGGVVSSCTLTNALFKHCETKFILTNPLSYKIANGDYIIMLRLYLLCRKSHLSVIMIVLASLGSKLLTNNKNYTNLKNNKTNK